MRISPWLVGLGGICMLLMLAVVPLAVFGLVPPGAGIPGAVILVLMVVPLGVLGGMRFRAMHHARALLTLVTKARQEGTTPADWDRARARAATVFETWPAFRDSIRPILHQALAVGGPLRGVALHAATSLTGPDRMLDAALSDFTGLATREEFASVARWLHLADRPRRLLALLEAAPGEARGDVLEYVLVNLGKPGARKRRRIAPYEAEVLALAAAATAMSPPQVREWGEYLKSNP